MAETAETKMTMDSLLDEVARQDESWGEQDFVPDDRWLEITTDEFNDLRWAVRMRALGQHVEKTNHDIPHEMIQTMAALFRWYRGLYGGETP